MARRAAVLAALTLLAAVPGASMAADADTAAGKARIAKKVRLKAFGSCGALVRYGRRHVRGGRVGEPPPISLPEPLLGGPGPLPPDSRSAPGAEGGGGDSGTNVQEAGVDEPDLVKATRDLIFVVAGNQLHAVKADGLELLSTLKLEGWGHQMLLQQDRLLVVSQATPYGEVPSGPATSRSGRGTPSPSSRRST